MYEKPVKTYSNNKLSQNRAIIYKKISTVGNTTQLSNLTKYSLNQNTTKLTLGDRTLASNKATIQNQSKSTIKKSKCGKRSSNIQMEDHVEHKMKEIEKIKSSLNMVIKNNNNLPG